MTREQVAIELQKMFCNYIQESDDIATFYEVALNYVEEETTLDFDDDDDYAEAMAMVENAIAGK